MAEKIRYTRRDLKGPDEFISTFGRVMSWSQENRSKVMATLLALVLALAVALGGRAYFQWREARAGAELWPYLDQAREMLAAPAGVNPGNLAAMEQTISSLAARHKGTRAALYAQYYLGSLAFRRGDYEGSAARYREAAKAASGDGTMNFLLNTGAGSSLEAKGDFAGAAESYRKAAETAGASFKAMAQFDEARALELAGRKSEAVALYRRIMQENPESIRKDLIEIKIARME